jgi:ribosome biogenesis GTPase
MKQGKILKGVAGFYYVHVAESGIYECKAKGIFRLENQKPLVGDDVIIDVLSESDMEGNITEILPRKSELLRPAVANVDQVLLVFAVTKPKPNINLLDRMLVRMERDAIPSIICFNKCDLAKDDDIRILQDIYEKTAYPVRFITTQSLDDVSMIKGFLTGKTTALAGPSGVGKSTLINQLSPEIQMETGEISKKIGRGKHTTRHAQLISLDEHSYLVDTPGFTSLTVDDFKLEELASCFPEFAQYEPQCRFRGCSHLNEPDCAVRAALEQNLISESRYHSYGLLYQELSEKNKY